MYREAGKSGSFNSKVTLKGNESAYAFVDKMAHHKKIDLLCDAIKNKTEVNSDILMSKVVDLKSHVIAESVKHQVLCELTAFICVGKSLADNTIQEYQAKKIKIA